MKKEDLYFLIGHIYLAFATLSIAFRCLYTIFTLLALSVISFAFFFIEQEENLKKKEEEGRRKNET